MIKDTPQLLLGAKFLDRLAFYGMRTLLVLFIIEEVQMDQNDAYELYSWISIGVGIMSFVGGLIADLFKKNKLFSLIGGITQATGMFALTLATEEMVFIGITLVIIGSGFFNANFFSSFSKLYGQEPEKMDSDFSLLYFAVNFGAFLAPITLGKFSDISFEFGFVIAAVFSIVSGILSYVGVNNLTGFKRFDAVIPKPFFFVSAVSLIIGFYWSVYEILWTFLHDVSEKLYGDPSLSYQFNAVVVMLLAIGGFFAFKKILNNSWSKVLIGSILAIIWSLLVYDKSEIGIAQFIVGSSIAAIAEMLLSVGSFGIIGKYTGIRFRATVYGASFCILYSFTSLFRTIKGLLFTYSDSFYEWILAIILLGTILILALTMYLFSRKDEYITIGEESKIESESEMGGPLDLNI